MTTAGWGLPRTIANNGVPGAGVDPTTFGFFGPSNQAHNPLFAGRVVYNFWDPEPDPAYYEASTYYGKVDVLSIGVALLVLALGRGRENHAVQPCLQRELLEAQCGQWRQLGRFQYDGVPRGERRT